MFMAALLEQVQIRKHPEVYQYWTNQSTPEDSSENEATIVIHNNKNDYHKCDAVKEVRHKCLHGFGYLKSPNSQNHSA